MSAENPASLEVAPNISRRRVETSRTELDAPLEPAPLEFACRASKETNKFEPTFGLRGGMDEFRRLKAMYPNASPRELAGFQVFAKAVARYPKDGRSSEGHGGGHRKDSGDGQRRERHISHKDSRDSRESRPGDGPSAGPRWGEKSDSSSDCSSSDYSRRDNRRRSHRRRKENNQEGSAESAPPSRSTAPVQLSAPPLPRPQHLALPTVLHPAPSEPASETFTRLSEVSSRPSQREDANRKCYASLDTKGLMKLPTIPFDIADGNSRMNLVNFTASLKEVVAQIRDLGEDFSEDDFWIPGWHKPLMRYVLNSVSHHHPVRVTRTKQMVRDAFARAEAEERRGQPGKQVLEGILPPLYLGLSPSTRIKHCSIYRPSKFLRRIRSRTS